MAACSSSDEAASTPDASSSTGDAGSVVADSGDTGPETDAASDASSGDAGIGDAALDATRFVDGAAQRYALVGSEGTIVATLGTHWTGYASFAARTSSSLVADFPARIVDAFGNPFMVGSAADTPLVRLPVPLTVRMTTFGNDANTVIDLTNVKFEITSIAPPPETLTAKIDTASILAEHYADLRGVPLSVKVTTTFFANFTSNACAQIEVHANGAKVGAVTPASPDGTFAVVAPFEFRAVPKCQTARLPSPQNAATDIELRITSASLP